MALPFRSNFGPAARTRRQFLTRAEIIEAAAAILERDGYDALNMRSVATELGVKATALYRYVASREELDDLLFDHLMADCTPAVDGEDWRDDMRRIAQAWRSRLVGKRDATRIALGQVSIGPNLIPLMEASFTALRRSGLTDGDVLEAYQTCTLFVHSFARAEATYTDVLGAGKGDALHTTAPSPEWAEPYPTVSAFAERMLAPPDFDYRFTFGFDALLAGIELRVTAAGSSKVEQPRSTLDEGRVDDAVLALLWLGRHEDWRAWKGFDWDALDRLHRKGMIDNPRGKAKSVVFTEEGLRRSKALFQAMFANAPD